VDVHYRVGEKKRTQTRLQKS